MKKVKRLVGSAGTYTVDGQEKTRWFPMGTLFQKDNGDHVIKLDGVPLGSDFNGWVNLFDFDEGGAKQAPAAAAAPASLADSSPDIPSNGGRRRQGRPLL